MIGHAPANSAGPHHRGKRAGSGWRLCDRIYRAQLWKNHIPVSLVRLVVACFLFGCGSGRDNAHRRSLRTALLVCLITVIFGITPALAGEKLYFYHNDHLGTPQVMTDEDQNVVWEAEYRPFGEVVIVTETVENNLRFPGQYFDRESNLHYNYFRDYDPSIGRYIEADPIGILRDYSDPQLQMAIQMRVLDKTKFSGGMLNHLYGYVGGHPLIFFDPFGLRKTVFPGQDSDDVPDDDPKNPDPEFPDNKNPLVCSIECSRTRQKGVKKCIKSCKGPNFYGGAACTQSWRTWDINCQVYCSTG